MDGFLKRKWEGADSVDYTLLEAATTITLSKMLVMSTHRWLGTTYTCVPLMCWWWRTNSRGCGLGPRNSLLRGIV